MPENSDGSKREFFAVDDYGMGGIWCILYARSAAEVTRKYPKLQVAEERPSWMTDETYLRILDVRSFDIDDEPRGYLLDGLGK
jgi:hypothetical protein